jgi:phosphoserine phosphatase
MPDTNIHNITFVLSSAHTGTLDKIAGFVADIPSIFVQDIEVLSPARAIDLTADIEGVTNERSDIDKLLQQFDINADFCIQPSNTRRKQLLICDMDSTLIGQECIDELADYAGVKQYVSEITERAMLGELDFEQALTERVGLLKDLPLEKLQDCFDERIKLNEGAQTLAATMKKNGATTVIVSGGFTFFTDRIADKAGFDHNQANTLIDDGSKLTGEVGQPILGRDAKKQALEHFSAGIGGPKSALAIGDGANDLAMIQSAGLGIAYKAKPIVANAAHCAIQHTDLTTALYFQGFKDSEFA